jgi:hypothetical protein
MMLVHISSLMILVVVGVVSAGTAAAFVTGHGRSAGHCAVTDGSSSKCLVPALHFVQRSFPFDTSSSLVRMRAVDNDDEDDGWGNADDNGGSSATTQKRDQPTSNSEEQSRVSIEKGSASEERDLFIPIFSIVSLAGLFGSYGYEMLRLYSRGELYLPWDHK